MRTNGKRGLRGKLDRLETRARSSLGSDRMVRGELDRSDPSRSVKGFASALTRRPAIRLLHWIHSWPQLSHW